MIIVVETIKAVKGKERALKKALHDLLSIARHAPGCVEYDLFEPVMHADEFLVYQKWKTQEDLTRHENASYNKIFVQKYDQVLYSSVSHYSVWKSIDTIRKK